MTRRRWLFCIMPILGGCLSAGPIIDKSDEAFDSFTPRDAFAKIRDLRKRLIGGKITFTKSF